MNTPRISRIDTLIMEEEVKFALKEAERCGEESMDFDDVGLGGVANAHIFSWRDYSIGYARALKDINIKIENKVKTIYN